MTVRIARGDKEKFDGGKAFLAAMTTYRQTGATSLDAFDHADVKLAEGSRTNGSCQGGHEVGVLVKRWAHRTCPRCARVLDWPTDAP